MVAATALTVIIGGLNVAGVAAGNSESVSSRPRCATRAAHVVPERTEGTATQAVAIVDVVNTGPACEARIRASLTVVRGGHKLDAVHGNPVAYESDWQLRHGRTMLFAAWWGNWCGGGHKSRFRARAAFGPSTATSVYSVLPACLSRHHPSQLTGVLSPH